MAEEVGEEPKFRLFSLFETAYTFVGAAIAIPGLVAMILVGCIWVGSWRQMPRGIDTRLVGSWKGPGKFAEGTRRVIFYSDGTGKYQYSSGRQFLSFRWGTSGRDLVISYPGHHGTSYLKTRFVVDPTGLSLLDSTGHRFPRAMERS